MRLNAYREKFGCLAQVGRVWAVSSIHGELTRLIQLHDTLVKRWKPGDRLVYLGNYLGRGPDIKGVLDELLSFRINRLCLAGMAAQDIVFLRGAQEEMWRKLLQIQLASDPNTVFDWMAEHGIGRTLEAYGESEEEARKYFREGILATTKWTNRLREKIQSNPGHNDILVALRRAAYTEDGELLFVHAGVDPGKAVIDQNDTFWWGSPHFDTIDKPYSGFQKVIRGYDQAQLGITETAHTATIDGGCGHGGPLYAACFNLEGSIVDQICID
ncbi:MAG: hypothetical protein V7701_00535 [Sneathiella sp.]